MRSSFLPTCQPKFWRISDLEVYQRVGQKSFKLLVGILGEKMSSSIHSEFNWPLLTKLWLIFMEMKQKQFFFEIFFFSKWLKKWDFQNHHFSKNFRENKHMQHSVRPIQFKDKVHSTRAFMLWLTGCSNLKQLMWGFLKVRKYKMQVIVFSILPKDEQIPYHSFFWRYKDQVYLFLEFSNLY